jgi:hypothetical protein
MANLVMPLVSLFIENDYLFIIWYNSMHFIVDHQVVNEVAVNYNLILFLKELTIYNSEQKNKEPWTVIKIFRICT